MALLSHAPAARRADRGAAEAGNGNRQRQTAEGRQAEGRELDTSRAPSSWPCWPSRVRLQPHSRWMPTPPRCGAPSSSSSTTSATAGSTSCRLCSRRRPRWSWSASATGSGRPRIRPFDEWLAGLKSQTPGTIFSEPLTNVTVHVESGQLAFLRADFTVVIDGPGPLARRRLLHAGEGRRGLEAPERQLHVDSGCVRPRSWARGAP